jgi:DNA primase
MICEAPIDALSLELAGFPAIAVIGTSWPDWLPRHCAFHKVGIAFDADEAGDTADGKVTAELATWGARAVRLRPVAGKDWNETLINCGADKLATLLNSLIGTKRRYCPMCGEALSVEIEAGQMYLECAKGHYSAVEPIL